MSEPRHRPTGLATEDSELPPCPTCHGEKDCPDCENTGYDEPRFSTEDSDTVQECPTCGSGDPAKCAVGFHGWWNHNCCPDPFHQPPEPPVATPSEEARCVCGHTEVEHDSDGMKWCRSPCQCEVYTAPPATPSEGERSQLAPDERAKLEEYRGRLIVGPSRCAAARALRCYDEAEAEAESLKARIEELEGERDEARALLEQSRKAGRGKADGLRNLALTNARLRVERDEARAEGERMREAIQFALPAVLSEEARTRLRCALSTPSKEEE
jgi:hypothetical protein